MHRGFGFDKRNVEDEMILEFADAMNFVVAKHLVQEECG